jgi:hypothetical protein
MKEFHVLMFSQETSCHTVEAAKVDEVFESASGGGLGNKRLNGHVTNVLTPITTLRIRIHSDAKNVLTGIIDSYDVSPRQSISFCSK